MKSSTLDKLMYWAATHDYGRFARRTAGRIHWTAPEGATCTRLHNGDRATITYGGVGQAMYQAARCGHVNIFDYFKSVASVGFRNYSQDFERESFYVAVSEGNTSFIKQMIDEENYSILDRQNGEGKTGLVHLMETHNVELVEHLLTFPFSFGEVSKSLMAYVHSLEGHTEGWCQRILDAVLCSVCDPVWVFGGRGYMVNDVWHVDSRVLLDSLRGAGKRRCEAECSVWGWEDVEIGLQDVEEKLRVMSREE